MACFHPLKGWRGPGGTVTFNRRAAWIDRPITVACGQCSGCRLERSRQWAVRCVHEAQMHDRNSFITLTYNDDELPEDHSLDKRHFQLFAKRVRKYLRAQPRGTRDFRYFHCGEYGDRNGRPHYHAAIFGQDWSADRYHFKTSNGNKLYRSELLESQWGHGFALVGELNHETAAYVARYVMKKRNGPDQADFYRVKIGKNIFEREPPYITMSRRPGIGQTWLQKYAGDVYPRDEVITQGRRARPPRYYDYLHEKLDPELIEQLKSKRKAAGSKHEANNTPERLAVREEHLRLNQPPRQL